jgi:transcriptional regulator with XRE-family HTH domain
MSIALRRSRFSPRLSATELLGLILRDRQAHGDSRLAQCRRLGIPLSTVYYLEQGRTPRAGTILTLRQALSR